MLTQMKSVEDIEKVEKGWGYELIIANSEKYCGKQLVLFKSKKCSLHSHKLKSEHFFVLDGYMVVELFSEPFVVEDDLDTTVDRLVKEGKLEKSIVHMSKGDSIFVDVNTPHRFIGIADRTSFIEFSTQHFDDDSYRIWPGDSQENTPNKK